MMRYCKGCKCDQPQDSFRLNPKSPDGLAHRCDACHKARYLGFNRQPTAPIPGYIYLIQASNGMVKIGITTNISGRLRDLNSSSPLALTVRYKALSKAANFIEHTLHAMFQAEHSHAEWFHLSDDQISAAIATIEQEQHHV
jgi:predicted GIY-YIG superfamily endonuclease